MSAMYMGMSRAGTIPYVSSVWHRNFSGKVKNFRPVMCASASASGWRESRRLIFISLVLFPFLLIPNSDAIAGGIFDKYVKREIIGRGSASICFISISTSFWPAALLHVNIRAVAQYASESGNGKTAFNDVDQCLRALEELDSLLLHASRKDPDASVNSMKAQINVALESLDSLLKIVPPDVLDKGKAIADSYRNSDEQVKTMTMSLTQNSSTWNQFYEFVCGILL